MAFREVSYGVFFKHISDMTAKSINYQYTVTPVYEDLMEDINGDIVTGVLYSEVEMNHQYFYRK